MPLTMRMVPRTVPPSSGTSSIISLIARFYQPQRGRVLQVGVLEQLPDPCGGDLAAGVVRVALADGWAGIFGLHVAPGHRRRGVGRWLALAAARSARDAGATLTYLQVEPSNDAAQQLYRGLGMQPHHDYVYLALPRTTATA